MAKFALSIIFLVVQFGLFWRVKAGLPIIYRRWKDDSRGDLAFLGNEYLDMLKALMNESSPYRLLERMNVICPLFGIVLTVWGLMSISTVNQSFFEIMAVYHGVLVGAVLAVVNQIYLAIVDSHISALSENARSEWLSQMDDGILAQIKGNFGEFLKETRLVTHSMANVIQESQRYINELNQNMASMNSNMQATSENLSNAGNIFASAIDGFQKSLIATSDQFREDLGILTKKVLDKQEEMMQPLMTTLANTAQMSTQMQETMTKNNVALQRMTNELLGAAEKIAPPCDNLMQASADIQKSSSELRQGADVYLRTTQQISEQMKNTLTESITTLQHINLSNRKVIAQAESCEGKIEYLLKEIEEMGDKMQVTTSVFVKSTENLDSASKALHETSTDLYRISNGAGEATQALERDTEELGVACKKFSEGASRLLDSSTELWESTQAHIAVDHENTQKQSEAIDQMRKDNDVIREKIQEMVGQIHETTENLRSISEVVQGSVATHKEQMEKMESRTATQIQEAGQMMMREIQPFLRHIGEIVQKITATGQVITDTTASYKQQVGEMIEMLQDSAQKTVGDFGKIVSPVHFSDSRLCNIFSKSILDLSHLQKKNNGKSRGRRC